jgi:hypothetical protein
MIWERVDALLDRFDGHLRIDVASDCYWGGELRLGLTNPDNAPARSIVFYSVAGRDPVDVAKRLLADAENWLATSGVNPLERLRTEPVDASGNYARQIADG